MDYMGQDTDGDRIVHVVEGGIRMNRIPSREVVAVHGGEHVRLEDVLDEVDETHSGLVLAETDFLLWKTFLGLQEQPQLPHLRYD